MEYNLYVIACDILVSMLCGAVTLLLTFQLRRDAKARIFLTFVLFECLAEASLVIARIIGLLGRNDFQPFFYLGAIFYTCYPAIWLRFVAEYFNLWTPFKRLFARFLLVLPVVMTAGALFNGLFLDLHMAASGSFSYQPTLYAYFIYGMSEISVLYSLVLVVRHALEIKLQAHRQLIFGLVVLFATSLTMPNQALYRTCGALGAVIGVLLITASILRYRLFDPLTQLNDRLKRQSRRLRKAIHQNGELLEQVRQADQAKTRFIGYISHEVRNPISNIYMTMQNVTEHPEFYNEPLPADYNKDLQGINRQTQHLRRLIDDLLDLGRIEADTLKLSREPLNPVPILREVQQAAASQLRPDVIFQVEYPASLPEICVDRLRFTQILSNIISNSAKFTEHGAITLAADVEGDSIRFSVRDTGVGMNDHVLAHLYEPYTQDAREVQQPHRGTGLGLSITKRLIELHGGAIQIVSKLGEGTAVSFTIPLVALTTPAEQNAPVVP